MEIANILIFVVLGIGFIALLVFGLSFLPSQRLFDRLTGRHLRKSSDERDELATSLGRSLALTSDLHSLLQRTSIELARVFNAKQVFFYIHRLDGAHHVTAGTKDHARLPASDVKEIEQYLVAGDPSVHITRQLHNTQPLYRLLASHRIAVVVPLFVGDHILGHLYLGDSSSGEYTEQDAKILQVLSSELVIAIENALHLHEAREENTTLQQRFDMVTKELRSSNSQLKHLDSIKDEFMSMASHQLRTPLTSVKGYLSMVLDGDAGEITPQQRKLLAEAFDSSERMVRLIADFLNVSRLQTGKFIIDQTDFDLKKVVRQEVANLELLAKGHNMKLDLKMTNDDFTIHADEPKLRQVVMNFIDNAIYYSKSDTKIVINLKRVGHMAEFRVTDAGIGVPKDEQEKLFNKFFRATNARKQRPDGTGVGLYLARKIVTEQGGALIFSSIEGKGSTFGFRMPIKKTTK